MRARPPRAGCQPRSPLRICSVGSLPHSSESRQMTLRGLRSGASHPRIVPVETDPLPIPAPHGNPFPLSGLVHGKPNFRAKSNPACEKNFSGKAEREFPRRSSCPCGKGNPCGRRFRILLARSRGRVTLPGFRIAGRATSPRYARGPAPASWADADQDERLSSRFAGAGQRHTTETGHLFFAKREWDSFGIFAESGGWDPSPTGGGANPIASGLCRLGAVWRFRCRDGRRRAAV